MQVRFGVLCLLGYAAVAWAFRFDMQGGPHIASVVYPFDTFSMYASAPDPYISHLLVREPDGVVHSVTAYRTFDCADPLTGPELRCTRQHHIPYHYDDLVEYIRSHPGPGTTDAELLSRTWRTRSGAAPILTADCVVSRCRVSR